MNSWFLALVFGGAALVGVAQVPPAVVGAQYAAPTPIKAAPGQVLTVFVHGIGANLSGPVKADTIPLPTSLAGISATLLQVNPGVAVPILAVEPTETCLPGLQGSTPGCSSYTAVTVQIPFEFNPTGAPLPSAAHLSFSEDGQIAATVGLDPRLSQVHILRSCDVVLSDPAGIDTGAFVCDPIAVHADGKLVSRLNPARAGEEIVLYGVGFGQTGPPMATGQAADTPAPTVRPIRVSFEPRVNAVASRPVSSSDGSEPGTEPRFVGATPGFVGLYQVNIVVPALPPGTPSCVSIPSRLIESNLTINIVDHGSSISLGWVRGSSDRVGICVVPPTY